MYTAETLLALLYFIFKQLCQILNTVNVILSSFSKAVWQHSGDSEAAIIVALPIKMKLCYVMLN